ncbi:MAG: SH3 domain-containing protein [Desulforhopalus sp.]
MRNCLPVLGFLVLFVTSTVATSIAGPRYYGTSYRNHRYSTPYTYHRPYYRGYSYHSDRIWTHLGIGLLTGAVIGSVLYQPPRERTIVYNTPPPVYVYSDPVVVYRQYTAAYPQSPAVLRQVITTPKILNIRSGPGLNSAISGQVQQDTVLDVLGAAPEWLYIRTKTGQYGWIMTQYTRGAEGPVG